MNLILYYFMLFFTILFSMNSNNWLVTWIFMEINLVTFIMIIFPLKFINISPNSIMQYIFIQIFSSSLFLMSNISFFLFNNIYMLKFMSMIMLISIIIKLGMFPFYYWFILIMMNLSWKNCFILSSIQKLIPLMLMMKLMNLNYKFMMILILINSFISTIGGLNQTYLKSLLSYSSMNHLSWMIINLMINEKIMMLYYFIYTIVLGKIIWLLSKYKILIISQLFKMKTSMMIKIMIIISILSMGGLPPFVGFMIKWMSHNCLKISYHITTYLTILMMTSTVTMFYYMYMMIPSAIMFYNSYKMNTYPININNPLSILIFMSLTFLMFNSILT